MPDQDPSSTSYGPFTSALTGPLTPANEQSPVNYAPSKSGAIALYLGKFLSGAQQAQRTNFERSEQTKREHEASVYKYVQQKMADPTLNDEGKQAIMKTFNDALANQANELLKKSNKGQKGKDPHPLLSLTQAITNSVLGPNQNKKHEDLGSLLVDLNTMANKPEYQVDKSLGKISTGAGPAPPQTQQPGFNLPGVQPQASSGTSTPPPLGTTPAANQGQAWYAGLTQDQAKADPRYVNFLNNIPAGKSEVDYPMGKAVATLPKTGASKKVGQGTRPGPDGKPINYEVFQDPTGKLETVDVGQAYEKPAAQKSMSSVPVTLADGTTTTALVDRSGQKPGFFSEETGQKLDGAKPRDPARSGAEATYDVQAKGELVREGVTNPTPEQISVRASEILDAVRGSSVQTQEQQRLIREKNTDVSAPSNPFTKAPATKFGTPVVPPSSEQKTAPPPGAPNTSSSRRTTAPPTTQLGSFKNSKDYDNGRLWYNSEFGGTPAPGSMAIRVQSGRNAAQEASGLDPATFTAQTSILKGDQKALLDSANVSSAYTRVQDMLQEHGDVFIDAAKELKSNTYGLGDKPLVNATVQWFDANVGPHPELQKYREAIQAVAREQSRLISGGVQSRAQLPVSATARGEATFPANMTLQDIIAGVDQLKVEADASQRGFKRQREDLTKKIADNPISKAFASKSSGAKSGKQSVTNKNGVTFEVGKPALNPKDGKRYVVKSIDDDGTIHTEDTPVK